MNVSRDAIVDFMLNTTEITSRVGTYRMVSSIFGQDPVPPQVTGTYIVVSGAITDEPGAAETKSTVGRRVVHDIGIYGDNVGDPAALEDLATRVRNLFNRHQLAVSGYGNALIATVFGPIEAPTDDQMLGRIVTVSLDLAKQGA